MINHLKVRATGDLTDKQIAANLRSALARNTITEGYQIDVAVDDGVASLTGIVGSKLEKSEAETVAQRAAGVTEIRNNLTIQ